MRPEDPWELCPYFEQGDPAAVPLPNGRVCGGIAGQPCRRCVRHGMDVRGMAEWLAETMGYRPRGRR